MSLIHWEPQYESGIVALDLQHKVLVDLCNTLYDRVCELNSPGALAVMDEMLAYARFHFSFEEGRMADTQFPGLVEHKAEHVNLLEQFTAIRDDVAAGKLPLNARMMNFLQGWVTHHLVSFDRHYLPYLKG